MIVAERDLYSDVDPYAYELRYTHFAANLRHRMVLLVVMVVGVY